MPGPIVRQLTRSPARPAALAAAGLLALFLVAPAGTAGAAAGGHIKQGVLTATTVDEDAAMVSPAAAGRGWDLSVGKGA